VIAEIKRRSPSKGVINADIDSGTQASAYDRGGAAAISVLTEPTFFGGSISDLQSAASRTQLPLLKKDFHILPEQIEEAKNAGASALLIIARALAPDHLATMIRAAQDSFEAVVEVRSERELELALESGAAMIGINSRDLETLEIDERVPERLMPKIPAGVIGIWESGIRSREDVQRAADCGADAVLVGSALSRSDNPELAVRGFTGVQRKGRRG
jgi:indole-3-glycerol phosphate synthase